MHDYAQALNRAALRKHSITPKKPNRKAGQRPFVFVLGRDGTDFNRIPKNSVVWSLTSFSQLLKEHNEVNLTVFKKGHKRGIVGVQIEGGPKIRRAYQRPLGLSLDAYINAYEWVNEYLASFGVSFTSSSWASEQLLRLSFTKPITVSNSIGRHLLGTSRGVCFPGYTYKGPLEKWDIRSAYPYAMVDNAHEFPAKAIPIEPDEWSKYDLSLVFARIITRHLPERDLPVIQVHSLDTRNPGYIYGWFWKFELETILEQFHDVKPIIAFKYRTVDLSDEIGLWQERLSPRYAPTVFAGKILKSIANALWGSYAAGNVWSYTWTIDDYGNVIADERLGKAYSGKVGGEHIAAWNNALVSDRVFREFIEPEQVVYFDTDGGFCRPVTRSLGNGEFGQWKFEGTFNRLEVVGWQAYAAWHDDGIQVVLSGIPDATYKDLRHYGDDERRQVYMESLIEDYAPKFNRVTVVDVSTNTAEALPYDAAKASLSGGGLRFIDPRVAPHVSHFTKDRTSQGWIPLTGEQTEALAKLSTIKLDNPLGDAIVGGATVSERKGLQNGNDSEGPKVQGRLWGANPDF